MEWLLRSLLMSTWSVSGPSGHRSTTLKLEDLNKLLFLSSVGWLGSDGRSSLEMFSWLRSGIAAEAEADYTWSCRGLMGLIAHLHDGELMPRAQLGINGESTHGFSMLRLVGYILEGNIQYWCRKRDTWELQNFLWSSLYYHHLHYICSTYSLRLLRIMEVEGVWSIRLHFLMGNW